MSSSENFRDQLQCQVRGGNYQRLLEEIQVDFKLFRNFDSWQDIAAYLQNRKLADFSKDDILRPIFQAHTNNPSPQWRSILCLLFLPLLDVIQRMKWKLDDNSDELWANILWAFTHTVCCFDVSKRPNRISQKVFNGTMHRLREDYAREWRHLQREIPTDPLDLAELSKGKEESGYVEVEHSSEIEAEIKKLQRLLNKGLISEADFFLLVGTRVYGKSIGEVAVEIGLDYQVAKKRRQRVEAKIRRWVKKI